MSWVQNSKDIDLSYNKFGCKTYDYDCDVLEEQTCMASATDCDWEALENYRLSLTDFDDYNSNNTTVEYKYMVDNWSYQENLIDDMQDGADCAPVTDYSGYANRLWDSNEDGDYVMDTFDQCDACIPDE